MVNTRSEVFQQNSDRQSNIGDLDTKLTAVERLLDTEAFRRSLTSEFAPLRAMALGCVIVHAFSKAIGHPEHLDQL